MSGIGKLLKHLAESHGSLTQQQSCAAVQEMLQGEATDIEIVSILTAIATRGATAAELTGFVQAMRGMAVGVPLTNPERDQLVDTCGTGGDGCGTFNISTGAALVAAAAGVRIAKHGNRGVTSQCGSADVLEAMGIPIEMTPEQSVECLRETGFMFLYAPSLHPALKRVQPLRRTLGFRTIFNLTGPLSNPAGAKSQVMGVFAGDRVRLVSETMAKLGVRHAFVVHGQDGLDELTLDGANDVAEVRGQRVRIFQMDAAEAGLDRAPLSAVAGGDARRNAEILDAVLSGAKGPQRDIVLLNAAAALVVAGIAEDFREGVSRAAKALDQGAGVELLERLRQFKSSLQVAQ